jgi:hypothetical protein
MEASRAKFADEFTARWALDNPLLPIRYENRKFAQPANNMWGSICVNETGRKRVSIGTQRRFVRVMGVIVVEVFAPEDSGSRNLRLVADKAAQYLEEKNFSLGSAAHVTTLVCSRRYDELPSGWARISLLTPFWFDESLPV